MINIYYGKFLMIKLSKSSYDTFDFFLNLDNLKKNQIIQLSKLRGYVQKISFLDKFYLFIKCFGGDKCQYLLKD